MCKKLYVMSTAVCAVLGILVYWYKSRVKELETRVEHLETDNLNLEQKLYDGKWDDAGI